MKKIKILFLLLIFSSVIIASGEISFKKQKEKILQEEQERENSPVKTIPKRKTASNKEKLMRQAILDTAFSQMGIKYIYGANGNGAYDCSSFVQYVYKKSLSINLPRVSNDQANTGQKVSMKQLKAGDLVAFDTLNKGRISHIGIYIGNNEFIHASSGYKKVVISELKGYYSQKFEYGVKIL